MADNNNGPWHRGYKSRKQQRKFEGDKPRKPVKGRPRFEEEPRRRKAA